jgi:hypothetical protein
MIMNLGNPIQLLLFMLFVGLGAYLGQELIGGYGGTLLGALLGVLARIAVGLLVGKWPPCACGNDEIGLFDLVERAPGQTAWKCQKCGKSYNLRGRDWIEILDDDTRVRRMRQGLLGAWKPVNDEQPNDAAH